MCAGKRTQSTIVLKINGMFFRVQNLQFTKSETPAMMQTPPCVRHCVSHRWLTGNTHCQANIASHSSGLCQWKSVFPEVSNNCPSYPGPLWSHLARKCGMSTPATRSGTTVVTKLKHCLLLPEGVSNYLHDASHACRLTLATSPNEA